MITNSKQRTAIIAHVFYLEIWPEISNAIKNLMDVCSDDSCVFVTFPCGQESIAEIVRRECPSAKLQAVRNVGWDVWPFFAVLNKLNLSKWDLVVKLHTKRDIESCWINFRRFADPEGWRRALLSFCSTRKAAQRSIQAFRRQSKLGMVAGARVIDPGGYGTGRSGENCQRLLETIGLKPQSWAIVWGTMWIMRIELLRPVWQRWGEMDFAAPRTDDPHADYGLAGDCEMLFGMIVGAQGYIVSSGRLPQSLSVICGKLKEYGFRILRHVSDFACNRGSYLVGRSRALS